jgi:hypothetical protein
MIGAGASTKNRFEFRQDNTEVAIYIDDLTGGGPTGGFNRVLTNSDPDALHIVEKVEKATNLLLGSSAGISTLEVGSNFNDFCNIYSNTTIRNNVILNQDGGNTLINGVLSVNNNTVLSAGLAQTCTIGDNLNGGSTTVINGDTHLGQGTGATLCKLGDSPLDTIELHGDIHQFADSLVEGEIVTNGNITLTHGGIDIDRIGGNYNIDVFKSLAFLTVGMGFSKTIVGPINNITTFELFNTGDSFQTYDIITGTNGTAFGQLHLLLSSTFGGLPNDRGVPCSITVEFCTSTGTSGRFPTYNPLVGNERQYHTLRGTGVLTVPTPFNTNDTGSEFIEMNWSYHALLEGGLGALVLPTLQYKPNTGGAPASIICKVDCGQGTLGENNVIRVSIKPLTTLWNN